MMKTTGHHVGHRRYVDRLRCLHVGDTATRSVLSGQYGDLLINADGSGTASLITDTNGTSVEGVPK
jgi:hypothetical protein